MQNINYADDARQLSDGELNAVLKVYADEQKRRELIRAEGADPHVSERLRARRERLFGLATF